MSPTPSDGAPRLGDLPPESAIGDFWGGGPVPLLPDEPTAPAPAIARLDPLPRAIRGRNPANPLRPAYEAMTSR